MSAPEPGPSSAATPAAVPSVSSAPAVRSWRLRLMLVAARLALFSATLLVCLVFLDRLYAAFLPIHMFGWFRQVPSNDVFYEPVPSISYEFMGNRTTHNAARMRDAVERS